MPNIKLCAFADESGTELKTQIENLRKNNIYAVEMRSCDGINVSEFTREKAEEVYKAFSANDIEVWSLGSPLGKIDIDQPFETHFEMLKRLTETAHIMHTDKIRMFSYFVGRGDYENRKEEVAERLNIMCGYAEKNAVKLCHENESEIFGATVDNCLYLYDNVPGLYPVYDPANFIMWDESIPYALEKLYGKAYYFHIKDVIRATKSIVPAGCGDGDIDFMVKNLRRDTTFTLEPHLHVFAGYSSIDKKQLKNRFTYPDQPSAFEASANAFKKIMSENGYTEGEKGIWKK